MIKGATYLVAPNPTSPQVGRKARFERDSGAVFAEVRWPNGLISLVAKDRLEGPVEPDPIDFCPLCQDTKEVPVTQEAPGKPWLRIHVGTEPCPNCQQRSAPT